MPAFFIGERSAPLFPRCCGGPARRKIYASFSTAALHLRAEGTRYAACAARKDPLRSFAAPKKAAAPGATARGKIYAASFGAAALHLRAKGTPYGRRSQRSTPLLRRGQKAAAPGATARLCASRR